MDWLPLLTAFGAGSIVSAAVQSFLESFREARRKRFLERKDTYLGLLDAYHRVARENSHEARLHFGYWVLRCRLVASDHVVKEIDAFSDTFQSSGDRKLAEEALLSAMRKDLDV